MAETQQTTVEIDGEKFVINGEYTYAGREFDGRPVEGLLLNVRAVQATFDDENYPEIASYETEVGTHSFAYPDTGRWDRERNVQEFIDALPAWRQAGILAVTINLQGGRPIRDAWRTSADGWQPYHNSAFTPEGELKPVYAKRVARVLDALDDLGMVAIVGCFYFGQDYRLHDDEAVTRAAERAARWLLGTGHRNIIVEIANEVDPRHYSHPVLKPEGIAGLIERVKSVTLNGRRLLASTSFTPNCLPTEDAVAAGDVVLPHGNGQSPEQHVEIVKAIRARRAWQADPKPIVFNEAGVDPACLEAAVGAYASWGYYDHGANDYCNGYQSPPVNWGINTTSKRTFFDRVRTITGARKDA